MFFSKDVAGVGLMGGYFDRRRSTAIQAFDREGRMIGGVKNLNRGMEYLALVTEDGRDRIAGLQFSLVGAEPAGYAIDDLSFAYASQLDLKQIPALRDLLAAEPSPETPSVKRGARPAEGGSISDLFGDADEGSPDKPAPSPGGDDSNSLSDLF